MRRLWMVAILSSLGCGPAPSEFDGAWRLLSESIYYDGGGGDAVQPVTTPLQLSATRWQFGASSGGLVVGAVAIDDWARWGVEDYGPTRKLTLAGWNGSQADGPIDEVGRKISFLWVIYRVAEPRAGTIWMKFGR